MIHIDGYMTPEEAAEASTDQTNKALGAVAALVLQNYMQRRELRESVEDTDDEDEIGEAEWRIKLLRQEESTLVRVGSMMQSRLKVP